MRNEYVHSEVEVAEREQLRLVPLRLDRFGGISSLSRARPPHSYHRFAEGFHRLVQRLRHRQLLRIVAPVDATLCWPEPDPRIGIPRQLSIREEEFCAFFYVGTRRPTPAASPGESLSNRFLQHRKLNLIGSSRLAITRQCGLLMFPPPETS